MLSRRMQTDGDQTRRGIGNEGSRTTPMSSVESTETVDEATERAASAGGWGGAWDPIYSEATLMQVHLGGLFQ